MHIYESNIKLAYIISLKLYHKVFVSTYLWSKYKLLPLLIIISFHIIKYKIIDKMGRNQVV